MEQGEVDGIPTRWIRPGDGTDGGPTGVALWLPPLGGSTEQLEPMLSRLAGRGLLAVSFDPPGQGAGDPVGVGPRHVGAGVVPAPDVAAARP
jgi:alpha-beta hydrolase superfamily lysophospholipase